MSRLAASGPLQATASRVSQTSPGTYTDQLRALVLASTQSKTTFGPEVDFDSSEGLSIHFEAGANGELDYCIDALAFVQQRAVDDAPASRRLSLWCG